MNRRELLMAITALPAATRIAHAEVRPASVIVVEVPLRISEEIAAEMRRGLRAIWPEPQRILVLSEGVTVKVLDDVPR